METISEYRGIALPWDLYRIPEGPLPTGRDAHGEYHVMTGLEGTGLCWLCGADPGGKRYRRYCWGHGKIYYELFSWSYASQAAIERADYRCENCGRAAYYYDHENPVSLEVHHIIPLEGGPRNWTWLNVPWNLIALCHDCHLEIHAAMRPNGWEKILRKAEARGQLVLAGL